MSRVALIALVLLAAISTAADDSKKSDTTPPPSLFAEKIKTFKKIDGFMPLYWNEKEGKLFLEIEKFDVDLLYQEALASGVGSNPLGLDRGQLGEPRVVRFHRVGPKVLLVEANTKYRAITDRAADRRAVDDSFAVSIHWGFKIDAEEGGKVLVDATDFFLRDAHAVSERLRQSKQGSYRLDASRSAIYLDRTKGFPKNTEVEAILTFANEGEAGQLVSGTTPAPTALSLRQHHSFVELPPLGPEFKPRVADPRVGLFTVDFYDFARPLNEAVERSWICRHRLIKKDPKVPVSDPVEPIVYYVDPGAPEPVRSALVEGASWWSTAFEKAGFSNAFKVAVLPDDADPMDLRYNVIQWVHRSTRGWSYGNTVTDPRTGEILKGRVTLDSLRARQDNLIGIGLVGNAETCAVSASPGVEHLADLDPNVEPTAMVLARIRQLSAHEVGHTLGFAHNFAASTYGNRASVMDYPAPLVTIKDKALDLSNAYAIGIGIYDIFAVKYAYGAFDNEAEGLAALLKQAETDKLLFLSDADARPAGAANPLANLWDNGPDPVASLLYEMKVRKIALDKFGLNKINNGEPLSDLQAKLLPLFLHHRYQLQAAVKVIGGLNYTYAVRQGDSTSPAVVMSAIPADQQRKALDAVLETIDPDFLTLSDRILALIPPQAYGTGFGTPERFAGRTGLTFDPIAAATVAADLSITSLLNPERAARLVESHAKDFKNPGLDTVAEALLAKVSSAVNQSRGREAEVARAIKSLAVTRLIELASNTTASFEVRAIATDALRSFETRVGSNNPHNRELREELSRFFSRPMEPQRPSPALPPPPGDPIGAGR